MAATDHPRSRRLGVAAALGLVAAIVVALLVGLDRSDSAVPLPPTSRDDVSFAVDVERTGGGVELSFVVEVAARADGPLVVTDFSNPEGPSPLLGGDPASLLAEPALFTAAHGDRSPGGVVVLHLGGSSIVGGTSVYFPEPPAARERSIGPGESLEGGATFSVDMAAALPGHALVRSADLRRVDVVRVCLWEAGVEPAPGERPAACADDEI